MSCCPWSTCVALAERAQGIIDRSGLPGEARPVSGGAVVFLPAGLRAIDAAKLLALFPGATYDHVSLVLNLEPGE